jgi:hypothetical protein
MQAVSVGLSMRLAIVAVAVAAVAACSSREDRFAPSASVTPSPAVGRSPTAAHDAAPATATVPAAAHDAGSTATGGLDAALAGDPAAAGDPGDRPDAVVAEAFHGHPPALPMLSADGKLAAIDLSMGLGLSSYSTYEVGLLDSAGAFVERIAVVDHALATAMARDGGRPDGTPAMAIPKPRLAKAAAAVMRRLAGFTPFAGTVDLEAIERAGGNLAVGDATLSFHADEATGLALRLTGANGAVVRRDRVPVRRRQFTDRDGGRCGGQPRLIGVWWDPARHRALLEINFPGHDSCVDEPLLWLLWPS